MWSPEEKKQMVFYTEDHGLLIVTVQANISIYTYL